MTAIRKVVVTTEDLVLEQGEPVSAPVRIITACAFCSTTSGVVGCGPLWWPMPTVRCALISPSAVAECRKPRGR